MKPEYLQEYLIMSDKDDGKTLRIGDREFTQDEFDTELNRLLEEGGLLRREMREMDADMHYIPPWIRHKPLKNAV